MMAEEKDWPAELAAISKRCGLTAKELRWVDGSVRYFPAKGSTYEQGVCVFAELKARAVPMKKGFVMHTNPTAEDN